VTPRAALRSRPNGGLRPVRTRATARVACVHEDVRSPRSQRKSGRRGVDLVQCGPLYHRCTLVAEILNCLKKHGQRLDAELAKETGVPLAKVRQDLAEIVATGAIVTCRLTRFEQGKRIDGMLYRMSGWVPPPAPGRKAKPTA
jgi:hypothetical protein